MVWIGFDISFEEVALDFSNCVLLYSVSCLFWTEFFMTFVIFSSDRSFCLLWFQKTIIVVW